MAKTIGIDIDFQILPLLMSDIEGLHGVEDGAGGPGAVGANGGRQGGGRGPGPSPLTQACQED